MCGFGVIVRQWSPSDDHSPAPSLEDIIPDAWGDALDAAVAYRGPDGFGTYRDRAPAAGTPGAFVDVLLVHRRLSIIDHAGGAQPMALDDERGRLVVVFNGCVYNHRELRTELESLGHRFASDHADTEVFLHGWRAWGEGLRGRLEGMFAAAIWDAKEGKVAFMRDRFGEKPLYLSGHGPGAIWLASSGVAGLENVLGMIEGPAAARPLDGPALREWIRFGHHTERTPFEKIVQLPHGGVVRAPTDKALKLDRVHDRGLNDPAEAKKRSARRPLTESAKGCVERYTGLIRDAVGARLDADVPVVSLLSGGVDSGVISALASEALREHGQRLTALTVRMPDEAYDETPDAARVAAHLDAEHVIVDADADRAADDLVLLVQTLGLPFGDSSLLPTYWVCKAAAELAGVALSGDGGDELFFGYERYKAADTMCGVLGATWLDRLLPRQNPRSMSAKIARLTEADRNDGYRDLLSIFPLPLARKLFRLGIASEAGLPEYKPRSMPEARVYDFRHTLPGDYLRKTDTASMLAGIELRAPLLDSRLALSALREPISRLRMGGRRKGLLREVGRALLPAGVVDAPKRGFAIPIGRWLREDFGSLRALMHDHLRASVPFPGIAIDINLKIVHRMLDEHDAGRADHGQRLYTLTVLSIWAHAFAMRPEREAPTRDGIA